MNEENKENIAPKRGRPPLVSQDVIIQAITERKKDVFKPGSDVIVSKNSQVWVEISEKLGNALKPKSIYNFIVDNKKHIKDVLLNRVQRTHVTDFDKSNEGASESQEFSDESFITDVQKFIMPLVKKKITDLLVEKTEKRIELNRKKEYVRSYTGLKPGLWQDYITRALWETKRIGCGFKFKCPKISKDGSSGTILGVCNCQSTLQLKWINSHETDDFIQAECELLPGNGECKKRYLRQPIRKMIAEELSKKSASVLRAEQGQKHMRPGDPEAPFIYSNAVLNQAKVEHFMSKFCDNDPFISLALMKATSCKNCIHMLSYDPFFVLYWHNYQTHVYRLHAGRGHTSISIDATGGIVRKLTKFDKKTKSKRIFLYEAVMKSEKGYYPVTQMLSECQDTVAIITWLMRWVKSGAPPPQEVITDCSKALLNAVVFVFAGCTTVEEYSNACTKDCVPNCYIRLDVAHFLKTYVNFLQSIHPRARTFLLSAIGQLIMAEDLDTAEVIVRAILVITRSETDGFDKDGEAIPCEIYINKLMKLFTTNNQEWLDEIKQELESNGDNDEGSEDDSIFENANFKNSWSCWANKIDNDAKKDALINGNHTNAHYMPKFAERLLRDIRWLPLWSCIYTDKFGFGRKPASSAGSESDFNVIKTHLLRNHKLPIRVDEFVQIHLDNLEGRMKIADAKIDGTPIIDEEVIGESKNKTNNSITDSPDVDEINLYNISSDATEQNCEEPRKNDINLPHESSQKEQTELQTEINIDFEDVANYPKPECRDEYNDRMFRNEYLDDDIASIQSSHELDQLEFSQEKVKCENCQQLFSQKITRDMKKSSNPALCKVCCDLDVNLIFATRAEEPWNKKGKKTAASNSRCSKYLGKNQIALDAISGKAKTIPMLKNGNDLTLGSIKVGSQYVSVSNTCAFHSLLSVLLVIVYDHDEFNEEFQKLYNKLGKLVCHIFKHGVTAHAYKKRAEILFEWWLPMQESKHKASIEKQTHVTMNCNANVAHLANMLYKGIPSFTETSICNACKHERKKVLSTLSVPQKVLRDGTFEHIIRDHILLTGKTSCYICKAKNVTTTFEIGNFIPLEFFHLKTRDCWIPLNEIPKFILDPKGGNPFKLKGIIDFIPPPRIGTRRNVERYKNIQPSGHYRAACIRRTGIWMLYDDLKSKSEIVLENHKVNLDLAIYLRTF